MLEAIILKYINQEFFCVKIDFFKSTHWLYQRFETKEFLFLEHSINYKSKKKLIKILRAYCNKKAFNSNKVSQ